MADDVITRDDLAPLLASVSARDRRDCTVCSKHEAHEARISRLEQQQDKTADKVDALKQEVSNLKEELAKTRTQITAVVLISSPVWTAIVGAIVFFVARGAH
jgi:uncharacterized protein YdcH (DUF465 family)